MINAFAVGLGGSLGAVLRHCVGLLFQSYFTSHSYFATFAVNFLGCFLIGFLAEVDFKTAIYVKYFLIAGLLGGFTTFSAFGLESLAMLKAASHFKAFYYVSGTVVFCLASVYLGSLTYKLIN